jgi:hypothetical protein
MNSAIRGICGHGNPDIEVIGSRVAGAASSKTTEWGAPGYASLPTCGYGNALFN